MRYTPQTIDLETRFKPFIPEYIPAVGDIDAFIKVRTQYTWYGLVIFVPALARHLCLNLTAAVTQPGANFLVTPVLYYMTALSPGDAARRQEGELGLDDVRRTGCKAERPLCPRAAVARNIEAVLGQVGPDPQDRQRREEREGD